MNPCVHLCVIMPCHHNVSFCSAMYVFIKLQDDQWQVKISFWWQSTSYCLMIGGTHPLQTSASQMSHDKSDHKTTRVYHCMTWLDKKTKKKNQNRHNKNPRSHNNHDDVTWLANITTKSYVRRRALDLTNGCEKLLIENIFFYIG